LISVYLKKRYLDYYLVGDENMVGCYIGVWAKNKEIFNINSV
jgi:hypothetical protein